MARPEKQGIDYYSMDIGFYHDFKVRRIQNANGPLTGSVLTCLLGSIYNNGYYLKWDKDLPSLIAVQIGTKNEGAVSEIIKKAIQVDFFDQEKYELYEILTSKGIQKRYVEATVRRKTLPLEQKYWLLPAPDKAVFVDNNLVNVCNNQVNVDNNPVNVCKSTQSKVKESKVKESNKERGVFNATDFFKPDTLLPKSKQPPEVLIPECLQTDTFATAWTSWQKHRKEKKQSLTPSTIEQQLKKLARMGERLAIDAIHNSITNGWTGLFEPKSSYTKPTSSEADVKAELEKTYGSM